jgi:hypothetical protein
MAGNRKFGLSSITRDDIASLTKEAADISGIPYVLDCDKDEVEKILMGRGSRTGGNPAGIRISWGLVRQ